MPEAGTASEGAPPRDAAELLRRYGAGERHFVGASIPDADLCGANLRGARLRTADLSRAKLGAADLRDVDLEDADLHRADLSGAHLEHASLNGANLQDANLTNVSGLWARQLAGADLSGARLDDSVKWPEALKNADAVVDSAQKLFLGVLAGCAYAGLTIWSTTDVRLLTNTSSSPLPIIQTPIPIAEFFVAAPLLLLGLHVYLHLYLQRLWEVLAELPAVFPEGAPVDRRADPWLLTGLVRAHFKRLRSSRPLLSYFQCWLSVLWAWYVVPLTLLVFWGRYLRRQEWLGTGLHVTLLVAAILVSIASHDRTKAVLSGKEVKPFRWRLAVRDGSPARHAGTRLAAATLGLGLLFGGVSVAAFSGGPSEHGLWERASVLAGWIRAGDSAAPVPTESSDWRECGSGSDHGVGTRILAPAVDSRESGALNAIGRRVRMAATATGLLVVDVLGALGFSPVANVEKESVSTKPPNWTGREEKEAEEIPLVAGAPLGERRLRHLRATRAFLLKARLEQADLRGSLLTEADLREADMSGRARLCGARLPNAKLQRAVLRGADLTSAYLAGAELKQAALEGATLRRAILPGANLENAELPGANLEGAQLPGANLRGAQLERTILRNADLRRTNLTGAFLREASLAGADLEEADLRNAQDLTNTQVQEARNWRLASYSTDLLPKLGLGSKHNEELKSRSRGRDRDAR